MLLIGPFTSTQREEPLSKEIIWSILHDNWKTVETWCQVRTSISH